jgi:hypothetical protein
MEITMPTCWLCKYFCYSNAIPGYSEFDLSCFKRHWKFSVYDTSEKEFRTALSKASSCKDYEYHKEKESGNV